MPSTLSVGILRSESELLFTKEEEVLIQKLEAIVTLTRKLP